MLPNNSSYLQQVVAKIATKRVVHVAKNHFHAKVFISIKCDFVMNSQNFLSLGACGCSASADCRNLLNGHTMTVAGVCPETVN